jgi:hypothetical protein
MGQAISYALNHWATLARFLDHGEVEIDNNWCNAARGITPAELNRFAVVMGGSSVR